MNLSDLIGVVRGTQGPTHPLLDVPLRLAELSARRLYWRAGWVSERFQPGNAGANAKVPITVRKSELSARLSELGVKAGAAIMLHSSLDRLHVVNDEVPGSPVLAGPQLGRVLLDETTRSLGGAGTLAVPTHPLYPNDPGFMHDKTNLVCTYNPRRTPSKVGILGEMFRRYDGVQRSLHPLSSLAVRGAHAEALLEANLNSEEPLPHGVHSGYYRFCRLGGTVISLNIPLIKALSIAHTAEEVRDSSWPVPGFFIRRRFILSTGDGEREVVVRERAPGWARYISLGQLRRDLLREGIMRETSVGDLRVDCADAAGVLEYMMRRNQHGPYPYYGLAIAGMGRR